MDKDQSPEDYFLMSAAEELNDAAFKAISDKAQEKQNEKTNVQSIASKWWLSYFGYIKILGILSLFIAVNGILYQYFLSQFVGAADYLIWTMPVFIYLVARVFNAQFSTNKILIERHSIEVKNQAIAHKAEAERNKKTEQLNKTMYALLTEIKQLNENSKLKDKKR